MNLPVYINFGTAILTFVLGLLLITGILYPGGPGETKTMLGIVLMIYGVYRFVTSITKVKRQKLEERRLKIQEDKEKLLSKL